MLKQKIKKPQPKQLLHQKTRQLVSWLVTFILIIQVVLPSGLFDLVAEKAFAAVITTLTTPDTDTDWDIGDSENIVWITDNGGGANPDYYKLYYSEDSGSSWESIDDNVAFTDAVQMYGWEIPVVNGAGEEDFSVKIEAYYNPATLVASDESDDFKIDYGPIASFDVDAEPAIANNFPIDITFTAKDQYDNVIINYPASSINISGSLLHENGTGEGANTVWFNSESTPTQVTGAYTWDLSGISFTNGSLTVSTKFKSVFTYTDGKLTFDTALTAPGYDEAIIYSDLVLIDAPTSASSFIIGTSGNSITFRAGGETSIDHLDLAYSPDNGANYYTIENGVAPSTMPQTYDWTVNNDVPGAQWKVRVQSYDSGDALIATGTSDPFTVSYGPVASFTVVAPEKADSNKFFSLTVTAKDQYGNTITDFNNAVAIGTVPSGITPVTIGNGSTTGSWASGVVTYAGYTIGEPGSYTITATYSGKTGSTSIYINPLGSSRVTGCYQDITAPASNVIGFLDADNNIIPVPINTYKGPITVVVEAQDPYMGITADGCPLGVGVENVELKLRRGGADWESLGNGMYFLPNGGTKAGYEYYKWTIEVPAATYATYYLYSIATDYDANVEEAPGLPGYDASTTIDLRLPYIQVVEPYDGQTYVAINAYIIVTFNQPMDRESVQNAFSVYGGITQLPMGGMPAPLDLNWRYTWTNADKTVIFRHANFAWSTTYTANIDPNVAMNKYGIPLDPGGIDYKEPTTWSFTTADAPEKNEPNLSTSTKNVNRYTANVGQVLTYTIVVNNSTGKGDANATLSDPIPDHSTYVEDSVTGGARYNPATNTIEWSGNLARGKNNKITFQVTVVGPVSYGTEIKNIATISDGFNPPFERIATTVVNSLPDSQVIGILDRNGELVPVVDPRTRLNLYFSPLIVVAKVADPTTLSVVDLWYRSSASGSTWFNYGAGAKLQDNDDGSAWYKWELDVVDKSLYYYFYTRATDVVGNWENRPPSPGYDMYVKVYTIQPYITANYPTPDKENVGITSYVQASFSQTMDITSVQNAITVTKADGTPLPDNFFAYTWYNNNKTVRLTHADPFDYITKYQVYIDPNIAMSANGVPINLYNPLAKPNEWMFTTAKERVPNITTSVKNVNKDITDPGDTLLYTVVVDNYKGGRSATVTVTDPIPDNTIYANYASGGFSYQSKYNRMYWRGSVPAGMSQVLEFQAKVNAPLDNGTNIVNVATLKDQTNPPIEEIATTIIGSAPSWSTSTRTVTIDPVREDGMARPGDILVYNVSLTNTGNMDANGVTVTDTLPDNSLLNNIDSSTGGFNYDPSRGVLEWAGDIPVQTTKTFSYQVILSDNQNDFIPPHNKAINQTNIADGFVGYVMPNTVMVDVPTDDTEEPPDGGRRPRPGEAPYITEDVQPSINAQSVKLYSQIVVPFSESMDTTSVVYEAYIGLRKINTANWLAEWDQDEAVLTLTPDQPLESGETYSINVPEGTDTEGLDLINDGPVLNNTWSFTTVRPALYFSSPEGPVSLLPGTVYGPITITLADWVNFSNKNELPRQYVPYAVEKYDLVLNLETTSETGRFAANQTGEFYTKEWGPWYNKPAGGPYLTIPVGQNSVQLYYTESVTGYSSMTAADLSQGYAIVDTPGKPVIVSDNALVEDQIYFASDPQSIPVGDISNPIIFGVMSQQDNVWLTEGRAFLLSTSSDAGTFYTSDKRPIDKTVTMATNVGVQTYYIHYIPSERLTETIYYQDSLPGTYTLTIADAGELGVNAVGEGDLQAAAVYSDGIAKSAGQNINILPLATQDLEEIIDELTEIEDETGRKLARVEINPDDITILPGGVRVFNAKAYDTLGNEIKEVEFSWYIIAGGGTIMRHGLADNNHTSRFTAGDIPGVYNDTVLVATYYNHDIMTDLATVRVARTIAYGYPGGLPSTGLNGIQWIFMILTLLAAVALAAVEHYEKTYLTQSHK